VVQVLHEVCFGLDVHKKSVTACVLWAAGRRRQTKEFGTFTKELLELADWLCACGVPSKDALPRIIDFCCANCSTISTS
jgi:hypothetical protein